MDVEPVLDEPVELVFSGEIWEWRGPAPFYFVTVAEDVAEELQDLSPALTYGWGMIPATVTVGATTFRTSLWPKDGGYVVPLRDHVRRAEQVAEGDIVTISLLLFDPAPPQTRRR